MKNNVLNTDPVSIADAVGQINDRVDGGSANVLSGIEMLDEITNGWAPGEFCIFGASVAMGKTSFVLSCISNIVQNGTPVALFSATDGCNEYFLTRVVCALGNRELPQTGEQRQMLLRDAHLEDVPLNLFFNIRMTLSYIHDKTVALIKEKGVRCVFIDTLQSVFASEEDGNTKEGVKRICHELRIMAKEFNIPIIVTSELSRAVDNRNGSWGKRPKLSDLMSRSAIEHEADSVYLFYRPEYYMIYEDEQGYDLHDRGKVIIAKNHTGACGTVCLQFNHQTALIEDIPDIIEKRRMMEAARLQLTDEIRSGSRYSSLVEKLGLQF